MSKLARTWPAAVALAVLVGAVVVAHPGDRGAPMKTALAGPFSPGDTSIADVTASALPSVVNISTTSRGRRGVASSDPFFNHPLSPGSRRGERPSGLGSGVIVSDKGHIITNNHVIAGASKIKVKLSDGRELSARLVGADPHSDVAVLELVGNVGKVTPIKFGDSSKLRLGEIVLAIGQPFGLGQSVTMGIVSAKGRGNMNITDYEDFIQTDAAINPGNSGGALINMRGELVGINTAILSRTGGYQGIGFAIPTTMVEPIMQSLIKDGTVSRGWLGVSIRTVDADFASENRLSVDRGVFVAEVSAHTPAAQQGLRKGDVIVAIDGKPTTEMTHLRNRVAMAGPGAVVSLDVIRGKTQKKLAIKLGHLPDRQ